MVTIESNLKTATSDLDKALEAVEQACQSMRWRMTNFDVIQAVSDLE